MRWIDCLLIVSVASAACAVAFHWSVTADSASPRERPSMTVGHSLEPVHSPCRAGSSEETLPGHVQFELRDGERFDGVATAVVYPEHEGHPLLSKGANVVFLQSDKDLDLTNYLTQVRPTGWRNLSFAVWIRTGDHRELRTGWARFRVPTLAASGIVVVPAVRLRVEILVTTGPGQPIPGAMLSIDDDGFAPRTFLRYGFTDDDGRLRVSGLPDGEQYVVSLAGPCGPARVGPVSTFSAEDGSVRFEVDLDGRWTFARYPVRPPSPGYALRIAGVECVGSATQVVWPVSTHVGPGSWPAGSIHLMFPEHAPVPERVRLHFAGFDPPFDVDLAEPDTWLRFRYVPGPEQASGESGEPGGAPIDTGEKAR